MGIAADYTEAVLLLKENRAGVPAKERRLSVKGVFIMLTVLFEILSILGMLFLILLAVVILFLLLVLFFPITYRIAGRKDKAEIALSVSADWLFGLLRFRYRYPEPGNALIKLLWFTVFDSRHPPENKEEPPPPDGNAPKEGTEEKQPEAGSSNAAYERDKTETSNNETDGTHEETGRKNTWSDTKDILSFFEKIQRFLMEKYKKMRYTFIGIYDKIKHIRENISYYKALLEDEETRLLFGHVRQRLGRILNLSAPGNCGRIFSLGQIPLISQDISMEYTACFLLHLESTFW